MDSKRHVARFRRQNVAGLQTPKVKISELPHMEQELHPYNDQRSKEK